MNQHSFWSRQPVVWNLIMLNVAVFLVQQLGSPETNQWLIDHFGLHFWASNHFAPYQLITYMFLHGDFYHVFFNMFAFWMFGRVAEMDLGSKRFLIYYLVTGVGAGVLNLLVNWGELSYYESTYGLIPQVIQRTQEVVTIGASGAVFGILLAFGVMHPNERIMLLIPPIPMKAKYFVIIFGVIELLLGVFSSSNVAHFAHVGGMLFGWLLLRLWKSKGRIYY